MIKPIDIGIVGAGPAGLASALYLHRLGHRVVLFERFETAHPVGSGLMLQPTGQAVLADLGLLASVEALGRRIDRLDGRDIRSGRVVLDVRYDRSRQGYALGIHRAALFSTLFEAVTAAGIGIETGARLVGQEMTGDRAALLFESGRRAGPFDLIVDCTGAGTPLRPLGRAFGRPRTMGFGAIWATVPWRPEGLDPNALMQRYRRADTMIGVMPIGRHRLDGPELGAFFWSLPVERHEALLRRGFAAWRDEVVALWPATSQLLENLGGFEALTLARYTHATLREPTGPAIAFVGDSAHSTSPQLGQGANMALLDAKALSLAIETSADVETALARYVRLRRWHVRLYQALSLMLTPMYQSESTVLPLLRDLLVTSVGRLPPVAQLLANMVAGQLIDALGPLGLERPARDLSDVPTMSIAKGAE